ncbi:MAG: hypothetical protein II574_02040 [Ruminococcus sp.]|nr:hypothetical protein [Ruminococcus sp.]
MKNDICRFMFRHDLKKRLIVITIISAVVTGFLSALILIFGNSMEGQPSNVLTIIACFYTFAITFAVAARVHGMELCFNRSRKTGMKAIFAELAVIIPYNAVLAVACEYILSKVSGSSSFVYEFKTFPSMLGLCGSDGVTGVLAAFGFTMLMLYAISVLAMLLITVIFRIGKYAWVGFWVLYMLLIFSSDSLLNPFKKFASFIGVSTGVLALMGLILVSAAFTAAFILLYRKTELNKNAVGFARVS